MLEEILHGDALSAECAKQAVTHMAVGFQVKGDAIIRRRHIHKDSPIQKFLMENINPLHPLVKYVIYNPYISYFPYGSYVTERML